MMAQMAQRGRKRIAFAGDKSACQIFHERYLAKDAAEHFGGNRPTCAKKHSQNYSDICISRCAVAPTIPDAFICANIL